MSFLHPEFLYYMLPPLFVLFGLLLTQKESQATFFSKEVMQRLQVSGKSLSLRVRNLLFMIIGILLIIALAGPIIEEGKIEVKAKSADIMIALDISDSMLAQDIYPDRLKFAKQKALELLHLAPNERIGVIGFAKNSYLVSPLSFDHEAVGFLLRELDTSSITEKGTNFLSMLEVVDKSIKKESKKYLLILSDGGDESDFSREIAFAKEKNIAIFILGIGSKKGAPIKRSDGSFIKQNGSIIISALNTDISELATKSGGSYIESVNSNADIEAMLKEIENHSEQKELKSQEIARFIPLFYFPLGLALLLLLIATSSMSKRESVALPSLAIGILFVLGVPKAEAGLLDFMELQKAQEAYEAEDFNRSARLFGEYAGATKRGESYYNAANALYKQGRYKEAANLYEKATFDSRENRAKNFANLGNAYVKQATPDSLQKGLQAYKESLKLKEDKEVQENLQALERALKKEQEREKKSEKQEQGDKQEGEKQEGEKQEQGDKQESEKQEQGEKQESEKQEGENQEQGDKQENQKQDDMKSDKPSQDEKRNQEQTSQDESSEQEQSDKEQQEQEISQEQNQTQELPNDSNRSSYSMQASPQEMSDAEQKKWLGKLNNKAKSYLYRLNDSSTEQEDTNEKPW